MSTTDKQLKYVEAREMGMAPHAAARHAGYADPGNASRRLETENPGVMAAIAAIEEKNRGTLDMTREKVMEGVKEAIDAAKLGSDYQAQIRGWAEINRMCGFYEPDKTEVTHVNQTAQQRRRALEDASDEELLERIGGVMIEDAEFHAVDDDEAAA